MREQTRQCTVALPQQLLWEYLGDYSHVLALSSADGSAKLVSGEPGQVGVRYLAAVEWEGIESSYRVHLAQAENPSILAWEAASGGSIGQVTFELEPSDESNTKVRVSASLTLSKALAPLEPFGWALFTRMQDRMMRRLHELRLEAGDAPAD